MNHPPRPVLLTAAAVLDAAGTFCPDAALLLELRQTPENSPAAVVLAVGPTAEVLRHPAANTPHIVRQSFPRHILTPAFVNAHTHLDLTHIGPQPYDPEHPAGFLSWVDIIRAQRRTAPDDIRRSADSGCALSAAGGVALIGDIAGLGSLEPLRALRTHGLGGVSFLEFFAIGSPATNAIDRLRALIAEHAHELRPAACARAGLQPHAPYSVSLDGYRAAAALAREHALPLATHLSENAEELRFVAHGQGPFRDLLIALNIWPVGAAAPENIGAGRRPVEHLAHVLDTRPAFVAAHVNAASDEDIALLARTGTSVAYCPRASDYFHAADSFGPHRYRDMLAAGVNVCLGTDSIVNLPAGTHRLSTLDEARHLRARDGTDAMQLLEMITTRGCRALGMPAGWCTFNPGLPLVGIVAIPVPRAMRTAADAARDLFSEDAGDPTLLVGPAGWISRSDSGLQTT